MPQSPQSHLDATSQFRQECQAASTPVLKSSPRLNYSTRLMGLSWRAGMVIGILLTLFINLGAAAPRSRRRPPRPRPISEHHFKVCSSPYAMRYCKKISINM